MPEHMARSTRARVFAVAMVVGLTAVSYAIWTSPQVRRVAGGILAAPLPGSDAAGAAPAAKRPAPAASRTKRPATDSEMAQLRARLAALQSQIGRQHGSGSGGSAQGSEQNALMPATRQPARPVLRPPANPRALHCSDFRWQQDAQAAYLADLSDPWGLDGPPGPSNDDGIACSELPVDPRRPPSTPVGARPQPMPTAPPITTLRQPKLRYFGLYTEQSPYSWYEVDHVAAAVGKVPSMAGYFVAGDQAFRPDAVISSWRRGMLPLMTWELRPQADMGPGGPTPRPGYTLADIANGSLDGYLSKYAHDVAAVKLPLAIRLDHEMNGNWYPWSIEDTINPDGAADYVRMWRRVHDIFAAAGATNAIWVWSPNRITYSRSDFTDFYPGDSYVDWIGLGGYYRNLSEAPTFDTTLGASLRALRDTTAFPHQPKPILLGEVGATERGGHKVAWITDLFSALNQPENADIIGFCWFDETVTTSAGEPGAVTNDWRITSSKPAIAAFAAGIADPRYAAGH
jgi:hypothetical protein